MSRESHPYQQCLFPSISQAVQHTLRDFTNFAIIPIDFLLAIMSLVGNLLVLTAVVRTRSLQHPTILLMCNLSVTDLLWAVFTIVRNVMRVTHDHFCPEQIGLEPVFVVLCVMSILGNLAIISRDRHLAVTKPWWYRCHLTRSSVVKKTSALWIFSVIMAILCHPKIYLPAHRFALIIVASLFQLVCITVMVSSYAGIFIANRLHTKNMQRQRGHVLVFEREKKLTNRIGLTLAVLFCTSLPALLSPLVLVIMGYSKSEFIPFRPFYSLFISLNGLLNPLLNYGRNETVRRAVRGLFRRPKRAGRVMPQSTRRKENHYSTMTFGTFGMALEDCSIETHS